MVRTNRVRRGQYSRRGPGRASARGQSAPGRSAQRPAGARPVTQAVGGVSDQSGALGQVSVRPSGEGKVLVEKHMVPRYPDQRVGIFIDVSNMYWAVRRHGASLNFRNVRESAVGERKLIRALAYAVQSGGTEEQKFFEALTKAGFEIKLKELQVFSGGKKKADWDVGMAMDMVRLAPLLDVVVLVSGDGDFIPVVEYLQNSGHLVEVMAFKEGVSAKLVERADVFLDLSKDTRRFLIR